MVLHTKHYCWTPFDYSVSISIIRLIRGGILPLLGKLGIDSDCWSR